MGLYGVLQKFSNNNTEESTSVVRTERTAPLPLKPLKNGLLRTLGLTDASTASTMGDIMNLYP